MELAMLPAVKRFFYVINLGAFASIVAHALILLVLAFGLPRFDFEPEEPEAIEVEIAAPKAEPPPPPPKPKPAPEPARKPKEAEPAKPAEAKTPAVMRPVQKFAEKDSGATKPGDAAREAAAARARTAMQQPKPVAPPQPEKLPMDPAGQAKATAPSPAAKAQPTRQSLAPSKNEGPVATTAMGGLARGIRAGQLCATELRRQMNNASPPYWPDLMPAYRLDKGNVLQVRRSAFRANARWYNLEFRCEVDGAATEVVSLDFKIGAQVPRAEWGKRGFPDS